MKRTTPLVLFLLLLAGGMLPAQQEVTIRIREGMPLIPLALPDFVFAENSAPRDDLRATLQDTLWNDLDFTRVFKLVPKEYYAYIAAFNPQRIVFKDWASIQANILVSGLLEVSADERIIFTFKVYEVNNERLIFGRSFSGKAEFVRLIAHRSADELMKQFGEKAIFTSKIVYVHEEGESKDIYMMDYDGAHPTRITNSNVINLLPSWSSDNEKIIYTSYRRFNPDLFLFNIYTGKTELFATGGSNYAADWSADGSKVVYTSTRSGPGNAEIYVRDVTSNQERRLTFNPGIDTATSWSPSAQELAFISDRSGSPQLYIMDTEGANVRRITTEGDYQGSPCWSPDGSRIAFVSRIEYRFDIYIYNLKNNSFSKLTENAGLNENPSWSPDGRHLVFSSNRSGRTQIYLMDYDGANVRQLTSSGENKMPKWQKYLK